LKPVSVVFCYPPFCCEPFPDNAPRTAGGDHLKTVLNGKVVPDYGKVQGILIGAVAAFVILITIIGPAEYVVSSSLVVLVSKTQPLALSPQKPLLTLREAPLGL
jgi:hypothetical protein